jgi:hypothetical protein
MSNEDGGTNGEGKRDWRTPTLIGMGLLVAILLGAIIGYVASGGLDNGSNPEAAATTLPLTSPGTTSPLPTVTTTPLPTVPPPTVAPPTDTPDTSIDGQITFTASEDTFTDLSAPDTVNGFDSVIEIDNDSTEGDFKLGLIRFMVTDIPADQSVSRAILHLTIVSPPDAPVSVYQVDGSWTELETTASNAPQVGASIATIPAGGSLDQVVDVDVTPLVTGNGEVNLYLATGGGVHTIRFYAREGDNPPKLTVIWNE